VVSTEAESAGAAGSGQPLPQQPQSTSEERSVEQNRIEELAQTKVEASERFPHRITGTVLFNALLNGQNNNNADNPTTALLTQGDVTGEATLRQSTLGLLFNGPHEVHFSSKLCSLFDGVAGGWRRVCP
jgi:hypothetical protein